MVDYNPKDWFTFIFRIHKADTVRKLMPLMIGIAIYAGLIAVLELRIWKLSDKSYIRNLTTMHTVLTFVISMLLVFRTNSAYDRWWEGRKLWGSLVNHSRNLAIKIDAYVHEEHDRKYLATLLAVFPYALKNHLRGVYKPEELKPVDAMLNTQKHIPSQIAAAIFQRLQLLQLQGTIRPESMLVLNPEFQGLMDVCGGCERIKTTPIPFSYSVFIKKFIFIFVMTLPFGYVFMLGYWVIPVVTFIFYVLASLELIAEEIENPFGFDANDLPLEKISETISSNVHGLLDN